MEKVLYLLAFVSVVIHAEIIDPPMYTDPQSTYSTSVDPCTLNCADPHWGYSSYNGPLCWGDCYDLCDTGISQSPINIESATASTGSIDWLMNVGYEVPRDMILKNNGHAVQVDLVDSYAIYGIGLIETYTAAQFHFHWGTNSTVGSEHTLNGAGFPMEMHIVHYSDEYISLEEAADEPDGLAVLAYFFRISAEDNAAFDPIVNALTDVKYKGNSTTLSSIKLEDLVPIEAQGDFYRYSGSLTTPACYESVIWSVFTDYIDISESQLNVFRQNIWTGDITDPHHLLENSYRPPQPLFGRQVTLYEQKPIDD